MSFPKLKFNDKTLTQTQEAYLAGTLGDPYYEAAAIDADDNDYLVKWSITNVDLDNETDESNMCDWTKYTVTAL